MKRLLLVPIIATTMSYANGYTQADRILDMQKMAKAMEAIQTGFFYNNLDIVNEGVDVLEKTIVKVRAIDSEVNNKDIYEKWINNNLKMTNKIRKKIIQKSEDIKARFKAGDAIQALQAYSKITQQCMKCHIQIRKW